ncbi:hypothetical protein E4K72_09070 [Oxalobacteraceae bacterium OM1]|nr:hypothetical protein E4K72_09070 [Oxalobacteraceae bacterium OM1]
MGVAIARRELYRQIPLVGQLEVVEDKSGDLNRIVKYARFRWTYEPAMREEHLYDPVLLWMHDDRFVLTGFERVKGNSGTTDYAQSWLCALNGLER